MKSTHTMNHAWSIICSSSVIDQETNNISLTNLIERISFPVSIETLENAKKEGKDGLMFVFPFEIVSRFFRKDANNATAFDVRLRLLNPLSKPVITSERRVAVEKGIKNMRVRTRLENLPVNMPGDCEMHIDMREVDETEFRNVAIIPLELCLGIDTNKKVGVPVRSKG